jgi:phage terminase large subunit
MCIRDRYIALQVWQMNLQEKFIDQVHEFACEHPDNTATKAARVFASYLHRIEYVLPVHLHGDPSANARSTTDDEGRSFFEKLKAELKANGIKVVDKVSRSAPSVALSGAFINEIYESNYEGWTIRINRSCRKSIEDYNMAKEANDGTILKKRITDKESKISFEKYGHMSDDKRYFITDVLPDSFRRYVSRNKRQRSFAA